MPIPRDKVTIDIMNELVEEYIDMIKNAPPGSKELPKHPLFPNPPDITLQKILQKGKTNQ